MRPDQPADEPYDVGRDFDTAVIYGTNHPAVERGKSFRPGTDLNVASLDAYRDAALRAGADAAERAFNEHARQQQRVASAVVADLPADLDDRTAAAIRDGYRRLARAIRDGYDPDPE